MSDTQIQHPGARPAPAILGPGRGPVLDEDDPFETMMERFARAGRLLDLDPGLYQVLRHPERQIIMERVAAVHRFRGLYAG